MLKIFGKDLLRYFPAQVISVILAFVSVPLYTRILSAEQFGQYVLVGSSVHIMVVLMSSLEFAIVRFYPAVPEQEVGLLVRTSFWIQVILISVLGGVVFIISHAFEIVASPFQHLINIGIVIFILESVFHLLTQVLRARLLVSAYSVFIIWERIAGVGLGILLAVGLHLGVSGILWGSALGLTTALPFLCKRALTNIRPIGPISMTLGRELAWYGIPLMIGQLTAWALNSFDRYQIQWFYSAHEVGLYAAAYTISQSSIAFMGTLFRLSSGPLLANAWEKQGKEASMSLLNSVTRLYILIGIPMVFGISILAEPVMKVLTGPQFANGYAIMPWIAGGAFFLGLQHRFNQTLLLLKRTRTIMLSLLVSSLLNVILNWLLLPLFDYKIAAVTTLVCYIFLCVTQASASRRYLRWSFPWWTGIRSLLASCVMSLGIYWLTLEVSLTPVLTLCVTIPIGILIYGLCISLLGEISPKERKVIEMYGRGWVTPKLARLQIKKVHRGSKQTH